MHLRQMAFDIGRKIGKRQIASRIFCVSEPALPLHRLARSRQCVAFCHPRPVYQPHVLVVATTPFPALSNPKMTRESRAVLLWEMVELAFEVTADHDADWRMIVNGGARQDIGQVHGHLIYDENEPIMCSLALVDPNVQFGGWQHLLQRIEKAGSIPDNGYSVSFRLLEGGEVSASFSDPDRTNRT